ncbi:MAG: RNA polymerase sigma factor [Bacteroidota bacterium]
MNHNHIFDVILIQKVGDGNKEAAELLVKRWHNRLISLSFKIVNNLETAKDIVQDSWMVIIRKAGSLNDPHKFKTWAFRIVHNRSIDWIRSQKETIKIDEVTIKQDDDSGAEDQYDQVRRTLKQLKDKDRIILTLFYLEGNNIYEISEILGAPVGTVKSRIFYAREHLKKKYKEVYHE